MKVSEITHQINEKPDWLSIAKSWMDGQKGSQESVMMHGIAGALYAGFKSSTKTAGITQPTAEDLAEYLSQARILPDPIRKAMFKHFRTGFKDFEEPTGAETGDEIETGDGTGTDGNNPEDPLTQDEKQLDPNDPADREKGKKLGINYGRNQTGWYVRSTPNKGNAGNLKQNQPKPQPDQETFAQRTKRKTQNIKRKMQDLGIIRDPNILKPNPDDTIRIPPKTRFNNSLDFSGKSLIAEAPTVIPDKIAKQVILTALQTQSRIGDMNKLVIPGTAQQPSVSTQTLFQRLKHEMPVDGKDEYDIDSEDPKDDQHIKTIAGQIKAMSQAQRVELTKAIQTADPKPTGEFGTDVPVDYIPKPNQPQEK